MKLQSKHLHESFPQSWKKYSWTFEKVQQNFVRLIENMAVYFNKTC